MIFQNTFTNSYTDTERAVSYASLHFPNTYYLAYRDLPKIIQKHVTGTNALDFGCGTGRSTRFLKDLGFKTIGIDISGEMIKQAQAFDKSGKYLVVNDGDYHSLNSKKFDLIFSIFTFDNIPNENHRLQILTKLRKLLKTHGKILMLDSTPEIYYNEWASFSTKNFPENRNAKSGEKVRIIMKDVPDSRPVEDIIWFSKDYLDLFNKCSFTLIETYKPLGHESEAFNWINETEISPWVIYVLEKN